MKICQACIHESIVLRSECKYLSIQNKNIGILAWDLFVVDDVTKIIFA